MKKLITEKQLSRLAKKYHCGVRLHGNTMLVSCSYKRADVDVFEVYTKDKKHFKILHQSKRRNKSGKMGVGHYEPKMSANSNSLDDVFKKISEHKQVGKMGNKLFYMKNIFDSISQGNDNYKNLYNNKH